jgi:osmoprotectant transport system permease protein
MTDRQMLVMVQLPLAMPTILAGVRTASVWVFGLATIAQPVGATSLGNYIFTGLQTSNYVAILFGCVFSALLALVLDGLFLGLEWAARHRSRRVAALVVAGVLAVAVSPVALAMIGSGPGAVVAAVRNVLSAGGDDNDRAIVIGGKAFTEQYVLVGVVRDRLERAGFKTESREGLGSTVLFEALRRGDIDCYIDYTGTILATIMAGSNASSAPETMVDVAYYLKQECNIISLGPLGFDNSYIFAVRRADAEEKGIATIDDLVPLAGRMTVGGDVEFFDRSEWRNVQERYGLQFGKTVTMDATLMYNAIAGGKLDVIAGYSTDGRIAANELVVLGDPRRALPPYDAILLVSPRVARNPRAVEALRPLINAIPTEMMRHANMLVDVDGQPAGEAARKLIEQLDRD